MQFARDLLNNAAALARKATQPEFTAPQVQAGQVEQAGSGRQQGEGGSSIQIPSLPLNPIQSIEVRVQRFKQLLLASPVDVEQLRRLAFHGIPDQDNLRALTWKVKSCVNISAPSLVHATCCDPRPCQPQRKTNSPCGCSACPHTCPAVLAAGQTGRTGWASVGWTNVQAFLRHSCAGQQASAHNSSFRGVTSPGATCPHSRT